MQMFRTKSDACLARSRVRLPFTFSGSCSRNKCCITKILIEVHFSFCSLLNYRHEYACVLQHQLQLQQLLLLCFCLSCEKWVQIGNGNVGNWYGVLFERRLLLSNRRATPFKVFPMISCCCQQQQQRQRWQQMPPAQALAPTSQLQQSLLFDKQQQLCWKSEGNVAHSLKQVSVICCRCTTCSVAKQRPSAHSVIKRH